MPLKILFSCRPDAGEIDGGKIWYSAPTHVSICLCVLSSPRCLSQCLLLCPTPPFLGCGHIFLPCNLVSFALTVYLLCLECGIRWNLITAYHQNTSLCSHLNSSGQTYQLELFVILAARSQRGVTVALQSRKLGNVSWPRPYQTYYTRSCFHIRRVTLSPLY